MRPKTKFLLRDLWGISGYSGRVDVLADSYQDQTAYIVSCGPSLAKLNVAELREFLVNKLVVSIKQSYELLRGIADFHVYNCANYKPYQYTRPLPIVVECTSYPQFLNPQCEMKFEIRERQMANSVAVRNDIADWSLDRKILRPYGPGIMYEIVFYLVAHLGVSKIVTIGWDNSLQNLPDKRKCHFYENLADSEKYVASVNNQVHIAEQELLAEERITVSAIGSWAKWLESRGIELQILSDTNPAPDWIPRLEKL